MFARSNHCTFEPRNAVASSLLVSEIECPFYTGLLEKT